MSVRKLPKRRFERRRSPRIEGEDLVAYYWTGAIPDPRVVRQIGLDGADIIAPESFYPGTVLQMVFEDRAASREDGTANPHICVSAMMLRRVADGFCVAFPFADAAERRRLDHFLGALKRRGRNGTNGQIESSDNPEAGGQRPGV